jgi:hypothetical protein
VRYRANIIAWNISNIDFQTSIDQFLGQGRDAGFELRDVSIPDFFVDIAVAIAVVSNSRSEYRGINVHALACLFLLSC